MEQPQNGTTTMEKRIYTELLVQNYETTKNYNTNQPNTQKTGALGEAYL
jgi:hypothetical protein